MKANILTSEDISSFIDDLVRAGTLNRETHDDTISAQEHHIKENILQWLSLILHIDVTNQCNLRCIHCYHPFDEYTFSDNLTLDEIKKAIDDAIL